jgi:hypothetical protein
VKEAEVIIKNDKLAVRQYQTIRVQYIAILSTIARYHLQICYNTNVYVHLTSARAGNRVPARH